MKRHPKRLTAETKRSLAGFSFILPWVLGFFGLYLLPIVLFLLGYFATGSLSSEGLRYAIAIAAFVIGIIPAIICDRRTKKSGALTFTIVRLF